MRGIKGSYTCGQWKPENFFDHIDELCFFDSEASDWSDDFVADQAIHYVRTKMCTIENTNAAKDPAVQRDIDNWRKKLAIKKLKEGTL